MRRALVAAGIYAGLTVVLLAPLLAHFGSAFPHDAGDPVLNTWIFWHGARTLPLSAAWWNGPMFFPMASSIALSELLLSVLPITWVVQALTHNPVAAYNAAFALSFPLCALAAWALARDLTGRDDAALVGGLAFMFATYRAEQYSHIQVLSYYFTPVVFLALHRYANDRRLRWLCLFGVSWLAQSLANGYAMFHVSVLVALWLLWFMRPLRRALPVVAAGALAALPMAPMLLKYEAVHTALHLTRDINEVKQFGMDLADLLTAAPDLALWGGRLGVARPETAAFPGLTVLVLAAAALVAGHTLRGTRPEPRALWQRVCVALSALAALVAFSAYLYGPWKLGPISVREFHKPFTIAVYLRVAAFLGGTWVKRMWRERSVVGFYILAMAAMYVLALGPEPRLLGRPLLYEPPYAWLMRLPGFDVLRVPARFVMLATLCQSVLVAMAVARWATAPRRWLIVGCVALGIVADGWMQLPVQAAPAGGRVGWPDVAAVIELPLNDPATDFGALFRAMTHGKPTVNGVSGYLPPHYLPLAQALKGGQLDALLELGNTKPLGVALDRSTPGSAEVERGLLAVGATPLAGGSGDAPWAAFLLPPRAQPPRSQAGVRLPVKALHASTHQDDVDRMLDGDVRTAWGTGVPQVGGEELTVDLGEAREVEGVVLAMGAYSFGYPSRLEVSISSDGRDWHMVQEGPLGVAAVRAAVQDPGVVPVTIDLPPLTARYLRLRQTGAEPGIPWWVAELTVRGQLVISR